MNSITISLPETQLAKLEELAGRLGISTDELVRFTIEDLLHQPDDAFEKASKYVLEKNQDLYQRLA
jgi:hypothetical protein